LRQQYAAPLFSFQVANGLLQSGAAKRILIACGEAQATFMPWSDWDILEGTTDRKPSAEDWDRATRHRGYAVIFGDGAGALVVEQNKDANQGIVALDLQTDGRYADHLLIPAGFKARPYFNKSMLDSEQHLPVMTGRDVFKQAITKLPASIIESCKQANVLLLDFFPQSIGLFPDAFLGHQFARHRRQHVVIVIESLQALIGELALHGE